MKLNEKTYEDLMNYLSDKEYYVRGDLIIKNIPEISNGANLREMINKLRTDGVPIVSTSRGYKLSKDKEEVLACITSLQSRINMMKHARDGMLDFLRSDPFQEPIQ